MGKKYSFFIEYDAILDNGLRSCRGGFARGLQNWALCLSQRGHSVDIYTVNPHLIQFSYSNVRFLDLDLRGTKSYDIAFINGWSNNSFKCNAKLYFYLDFSKNWMICKPPQVEMIKDDRVLVGYPFRSLEEHFLSENQFIDKTIFLPFPVYNHFSWEETLKKNNFNKDGWSISVRHAMPEGENKTLEIKNFIKDQCRKRDKRMVDFPFEQPYDFVWQLMPSLQLLFPVCDSASSLEAILSGTVPLPIFMKQTDNPAGQVLRKGAEDAGILMERPPNKAKLAEMIEFILSSKAVYQNILDSFRDSIKENMFENAYSALISAIEDRLE